MKKFYIIGIDDNGQREFQAEVREIITTHRVFSGGKRHYELMRDRLPEQMFGLCMRTSFIRELLP